MKNYKKVCYVSCYKFTDYTRTNSIINSLKLIDNTELIVVRNKHKGIIRYFEVPVKLMMTRIRNNPDTYVVGFRAHEIFWAFYISMVGKKIIFDEFIDLHDWLVNEHKKPWAIRPLMLVIDNYMKNVMRLSNYVLTDTQAHAKLCNINYGIPLKKIKPIPIGADEELYFPEKKVKNINNKFNVIFYGSMLPLHGIDIVLDSIKLLSRQGKIGNVHLTFAGGRGKTVFIKNLRKFINDNELNDNITHIEWVESDKLPNYLREFDLCLGGPFGNTGQARRVITGKTYQLLAAAKPTVVGRIDGMKGFKDKNNCILIEQGSSKELAKAILWASNNQNKLQDIGNAGRKLYEEQFSSSKISSLLKELL